MINQISAQNSPFNGVLKKDFRVRITGASTCLLACLHSKCKSGGEEAKIKLATPLHAVAVGLHFWIKPRLECWHDSENEARKNLQVYNFMMPGLEGWNSSFYNSEVVDLWCEPSKH
ncbi:hypothetical protein QQP08_003100 [Theobroma cacao]|nr:hypothetical protein QQP08_003100 [Theobroma cacao]